jgi:hypothetical protein
MLVAIDCRSKNWVAVIKSLRCTDLDNIYRGFLSMQARAAGYALTDLTTPKLS